MGLTTPNVQLTELVRRHYRAPIIRSFGALPHHSITTFDSLSRVYLVAAI